MSLWTSLSKAAREAAEESPPDWPKVKSLWLVADACSLVLRADSANEPFIPMMVFGDRRSAIAQDFLPGDAALLSEIAVAVSHRALQARLSDLAWLNARPKRNIADSHRAIDAYGAAPLDEPEFHSSLVEWRRAIVLARQLKDEGRAKLARLISSLESTAEREIPKDGGLGKSAARVLFDLRVATDKGATLADLLATSGERQSAAGNHYVARNLLGHARDWYVRLSNAERAADMTVAMALTCEAEADQRIQEGGDIGHVMAGSFLDDAIQLLRAVPGAQRPARGVDACIERILKRLTVSGQQAMKAMHTYSTGKMDITEHVQEAERAVSGKSGVAALLTMARLHGGAQFARLKAGAQESMQTHLFSAAFASTHYGPDGRVVAKTPGGLSGVDTDLDQQLFGLMMRHYLLDIELVCRAVILPALGIIQREHTVRKSELAQLMSLAPVVPPGRAEQFAKGLWEGFEYDFATATYILAPQVENLVRWHLKQRQVLTTTVDRSGIENEVGLSALIDLPQIVEVFGEDLAFELRALFCSALGPNIRNQVAHGLLNHDECNTVPAVYAWWWVLRLTLKSFHDAQVPAGHPSVEPVKAA